MRLIEGNLKEVSVDEYTAQLGAQEMVINLTFDNGMAASIALSKDKIFVELMSPAHKFFIGALNDIDFQKRVGEQAEEVKKALIEEGTLPLG